MREHRSRFSVFALILLLGAVGASSLDPGPRPFGDTDTEHTFRDVLPGVTWAEVAPVPGPLGGVTTSDRTGRHHALGTGSVALVRDRVTRRVVARRSLRAPPGHFGERLLGLTGHPATAPPES